MARLLLVALSLIAIAAHPCVGLPKIDGKNDLNEALQALEAAGKYKTFLRLFKSSGFRPVLSRYIQAQPVALLVPQDKAFANAPLRVRKALTGAKLMKLLEYHMLTNKLPMAYLQYALSESYFSTVYGVYLRKKTAATKETVIFAPDGVSAPNRMATIVQPDVCGTKLRTLSVHGVSNLLYPNDLFSVATH